MEGPVPSVVETGFALDGHQPFAGRALLEGHAVWLVVGYEADAPTASGDMAWGAQVSQKVGDWLEVGAGVAREGQPAGGATDPGGALPGPGGVGDYLVWGGHARVQAAPGSWAAIELAGTTSREGLALRSTDGGLRFDPIASAATATDGGWGLMAVAEADVGSLARLPEGRLDLRVRGHWQLLQPGFRVAGLASEEGSEKWGGEVTWRPDGFSQARLRYDGGAFMLASDQVVARGAVRRLERHRLLGRYEQDLAPGLSLHGEATVGDQQDALLRDPLAARDPANLAAPGVTAPSADRLVGGLAVGARWRLLPRLTLTVGQEALVGGDDRILGRDGAARVQTEVGTELGLTESLRLRALGAIRWNGDHAARLGLVTTDEGGRRSYLEERVTRGAANGRLVRSSVVGLETDVGGGRAFGEYRLDGGVGGHTNRAVLGLSRAFDLAPGVRALVAWERSAALGTGAVSRGARDVASGGLQLLGSDRLKLSGLFELRWDRDRPGEAAAEVLQAVSRLNADLHVLRGLTVLGLLDHALTQDLATRSVLAEDLRSTLGLAWRPASTDDIVLTLRWTHAGHRSALRGEATEGLRFGLTDGLVPTGASASASASDVVSLAGLFELPWRLALTEKLALRMSEDALRDEALGWTSAVAHVGLWLNRLAWHLLPTLDLATEVRLVTSLGAADRVGLGGLLEASWRFVAHARAGLGWSFGAGADGFETDGTRATLRNGLYFRMTGLY
jgi:hypothetical protein